MVLVEALPTHRGFVYYLQEKYEFHIQVTRRNPHMPNTRYLKCTHRNCKVGITINDADEVIAGGDREHIHASYEDERKRKTILHRIRQRVRSENIALRVIYNEEIARFPLEITAPLNYKSKRETFRRWRNEGKPPIPRTLTEFANTLANERHAYLGFSFDVRPLYRGIVGDHSMVFLSEELSRFLEAPGVDLNCDGTFRAIPQIPGVKQMITIMAWCIDRPLPVCWILMTNKNTECYRAALRFLKELLPAMESRAVIADFERSLHRAFTQVFPNIVVEGCWFHYIQALCRNRSRFGMGKRVLQANQELRRIFNMCKSLPLLPANDIDAGLRYVERFARRHQQSRRFLQYIRRTWIPQVNVLSVYRRNRRTNNDIESYHSTLMQYMGTNRGVGLKPATWNYLDGVRNIERDAVQIYGNLRMNVAPPRNRRRAQIRHDNAIDRAWNEYDDGRLPLPEFVRWMAHHANDVEIDGEARGNDSDEDDIEMVEIEVDIGDWDAPRLEPEMEIEEDVDDDVIPEEELCVVCMELRIGFRVQPCGCARFCGPCIRLLQHDGRDCPWCRGAILRIEEVA